MTVNVDYTYQDLEDYFHFTSEHPKYKRQVRISYLRSALIGGVFSAALFYWTIRDIYWSLGTFVFLVLVYYPISLLKYKSHLRSWTESAWPKFPQKRTFETTPEGLKVSDKDTSLLLYWHKISSIEANKSYLFFEVAGEGFYHIPRRSFPNQEASQTFLETSQALRNGTAPPGSWWTQGQNVLEIQSNHLGLESSGKAE